MDSKEREKERKKDIQKERKKIAGAMVRRPHRRHLHARDVHFFPRTSFNAIVACNYTFLFRKIFEVVTNNLRHLLNKTKLFVFLVIVSDMTLRNVKLLFQHRNQYKLQINIYLIRTKIRFKKTLFKYWRTRSNLITSND